MRYNETYNPDGRLIEQVIDRGDGTGTRTTYNDDGTVQHVEQITGLPVVDDTDIPPTVAELQAALAVQQATLDALLDALTGDGTR